VSSPPPGYRLPEEGGSFLRRGGVTLLVVGGEREGSGGKETGGRRGLQENVFGSVGRLGDVEESYGWGTFIYSRGKVSGRASPSEKEDRPLTRNKKCFFLRGGERSSHPKKEEDSKRGDWA